MWILWCKTIFKYFKIFFENMTNYKFQSKPCGWRHLCVYERDVCNYFDISAKYSTAMYMMKPIPFRCNGFFLDTLRKLYYFEVVLFFVFPVSTGLWRAEMRRGGFSLGYELLGQIFVCWADKENKITVTGSHLYVFGIKNEGNHSFNSWEVVYIHRQFNPT